MMLKANLTSRIALANGSRRVTFCRAAETETPTTPATPAPTTPAATESTSTEVPEALKPVVQFLSATDFKLEQTDLYKNTLKQYLENKYVVDSTGFKELPETINGRAAMIGFVAGASAEILGAGPFLLQLSKYPQPVLALLALITAGSIIPIVKGTEGGYLKSLRETYTIPEDVFTETNERIYGRLAMLGTGEACRELQTQQS
eukprot:gene7000-7214_t